MNLVAELRWRGMIADIMPGTEEQLQKEMLAFQNSLMQINNYPSPQQNPQHQQIQ